MRWLRPTWLTAGVVVLLVPLMFGLFVLVGWDAGVLGLYMLLVEVPFERCRSVGLPVGRRGDWYGFAFPNGLGWTLIAATDVVVLYLLGSVLSAAWHRSRGPLP